MRALAAVPSSSDWQIPNMSTREQVVEFLTARGLNADRIDVDTVLQDFLEEMERGLAGEDCSLAMIPTHVTIDRPVPTGEPVLVMDAGGTHLRVAAVRFDAAGVPSISHFQQHSMPGIDEEVSPEDFFGALSACLDPVADAADRIGFCFSYATEITPDCDGKLLHWTKEIKAPGVVGAYVGAGLLRGLAARGHGGKRVVVLNDTIATLLAGKSVGSARQYESYTGVILGTGTNTAYVERNARITKQRDLDPAGAQAINLESGGFARCPRSEFDEAFDRTTANPGTQCLEKMIAGGYLGGLALQVLRTAAAAGLFSAEAAARIRALAEWSTVDLSALLNNPLADGPLDPAVFPPADLRTAFHLCTEVVRRAAVLAAINVSAPIIKTGRGRDPLHPVCVTVDGSTFYRTRGLRSLVEEHLRTILGPRGIHYDILKVDDAPLIGAAVAGLTV